MLLGDTVPAAEPVAALEPERDRAVRIVAARGLSARTARFLAVKGFGPELVAIQALSRVPRTACSGRLRE